MGTHTVLREDERYELLGELASGGMATVYLARMRRPMGFSRLVAIKCMHPQFAKDPSFVSMFLDEARLTARLRHPNIVPTLDIVAEDGHLLLVMEYIEGTSLANLLRSASKAGTRIPIPIACAIIHDVLLGLHEAHQAKDDEGAPLAIVHRDVSPQNVLVGLDGLSRVLDFGVARARQNTHHSNDNEIKGKIPYMPPEQLFGEAIDHKVDVYAAGVSLWEALVCERLFDGPSETALVKKISEDPIERPSTRIGDLPPALDAIVMRALERNAGDRFESALAMAEAIAGVVSFPTRTEVSAWIRQFVTPREVPSGTRLSEVSPEDPSTAIVAILQKASVQRPSKRRPAPGARGAMKTRAARLGMIGGGIALAVGVIALAWTPLTEAATSRSGHTNARSTNAPPPAAQELPAPRVAPAPPPEPEPRALMIAPARPTPAPLVRPAFVGQKPTVQAPAPVAEKAKDCKVPFTVDANGHRHYKEECVQ